MNQTFRVWVDTAFNGGLVVPRREIERLHLREQTSTPAILADGKQVDLPTYTCYLKWFGDAYRTQVVANEGEYLAFPLQTDPVFMRDSHPGEARKGFFEDEEDTAHDRSDY